jgi:hypothetical protein
MVKVRYDEGLTNHIGPESCVAVREGVRETLTGERAGQAIEGGVSPNRRNFRRRQTFRFSMLGLARWDGKTPQQRRIDSRNFPFFG